MTNEELKAAIELVQRHQDCIGYQSLTMFDRKTDAIKAWNTRAQPKYKRVNLDELYVTIYFPDGRKDSVETDAYNRAIDDIKSKYGDLYVEVK